MYVIGALCKNGHTYGGKLVSLRYASTRQCVRCMSERRQTYGITYYQENAEEIRRKARDSHHANRDRQLARMKAYNQTDAYRQAQKKWRENNREKVAENTKDWKQENKERVTEYNKAYYAKNREHERQRSRRYQKENAEKIATAQRDYRKKNKSRIREREEQWRATPQGRLKRLTTQRRRQGLLKGQQSQIPAEQLNRLFEYFDYSCAYCGIKGNLTIDHVLPVASGGTDLNNLVPACGSCNSSKSKKQMEVWYRKQSFFSEERLKRILDFVRG
jgi:5-methylcytosine-specific restriction endonuclease McrA